MGMIPAKKILAPVRLPSTPPSISLGAAAAVSLFFESLAFLDLGVGSVMSLVRVLSSSPLSITLSADFCSGFFPDFFAFAFVLFWNSVVGGS
jgi:hypothetical protein